MDPRFGEPDARQFRIVERGGFNQPQAQAMTRQNVIGLPNDRAQLFPDLPRLALPRRLAAGGVMEIDPATRRNLELDRTLAGERRGSLLADRKSVV